jgi:hypothetical protein
MNNRSLLLRRRRIVPRQGLDSPNGGGGTGTGKGEGEGGDVG